MTTLTYAIDIDAPIQTVWSVLTQFDSYESWNKFSPVVETAGGLGDGVTLHVKLNDSGRLTKSNLKIEQIEPYSDVLFLESGTDGIEISESDYDAHNTWAWITKKPLCYMVPHVLAWGVLFCFAFYPIFGRPKQTVNTRNRSFGDHIGALGRLSSRHLTLSTARLKVRKYLNTDDGTSTKQSNVSKSSEDRVSR